MGRSKKITGVSGIISAAHRDVNTGRIHGHTWEIVAWFTVGKNIENAEIKKYAFDQLLSSLDHDFLPDALAWGENMAEYIGQSLGCSAVDVNRKAEGIFARWEA